MLETIGWIGILLILTPFEFIFVYLVVMWAKWLKNRRNDDETT